MRDHGGVLFIDLRDHYGITQVLCDGDSAAFKALEAVRSEWVIRIDGRVKARDASLVNAKIPTGEIEVYVTEVEVLGASEELPLPVFGDAEYPEETRLTYRFLDLRRDTMHQNMMLRSNVCAGCATPCGIRGSPNSRRRSSPPRRPKGRVTFWCRRACIRASSTPFRKRRSSSSS